MTLRLEIPDLPPSLNKTLRMHWAKKRKLNETWQQWVRAMLPEYFLEPMVRMRCTITLHHSRFYDKDNAYGAVKPVVDALRLWKLIRDDTREYLDLQVEQSKCSHKKRSTTIELEPA